MAWEPPAPHTNPSQEDRTHHPPDFWPLLFGGGFRSLARPCCPALHAALRSASCSCLFSPPSLSLPPPLTVFLSCVVCPSVSTSDIVFFGENLPARFFSCIQSVSIPAPTRAQPVWGQPGPAQGHLSLRGGGEGDGPQTAPSQSPRGTAPPQDFLKVDLLIIMGTSLQVQPFASLIGK